MKGKENEKCRFCNSGDLNYITVKFWSFGKFNESLLVVHPEKCDIIDIAFYETKTDKDNEETYLTESCILRGFDGDSEQGTPGEDRRKSTI